MACVYSVLPPSAPFVGWALSRAKRRDDDLGLALHTENDRARGVFHFSKTRRVDFRKGPNARLGCQDRSFGTKHGKKRPTQTTSVTPTVKMEVDDSVLTPDCRSLSTTVLVHASIVAVASCKTVTSRIGSGSNRDTRESG
jgi:hypothetical protein